MHDTAAHEALQPSPPTPREADELTPDALDEVTGGASDDGREWQAHFFETWASDSL